MLCKANVYRLVCAGRGDKLKSNMGKQEKLRKRDGFFPTTVSHLSHILKHAQLQQSLQTCVNSDKLSLPPVTSTVALGGVPPLFISVYSPMRAFQCHSTILHFPILPPPHFSLSNEPLSVSLSLGSYTLCPKLPEQNFYVIRSLYNYFFSFHSLQHGFNTSTEHCQFSQLV